MAWNEFCLGIAFMGLTGSLGCIIYFLFGKLLDKYCLKLKTLKIITILFLIPLTYPLIVLSNISYKYGEFVRLNFVAGSWPEPERTICAIISLFWVIGLLIGVIMRICQFLSFSQTIKDQERADEQWNTLVEEYSEKYKMKSVEVFQNPLVNTALVTGKRNPIIIIPDKQYSEQQMSMIVEHELFHIFNRDLRWKQLAMVVTWVHWFNPFAYWLLHQINLEQEINCDLAVCDVNPLYTKKEYCQFLFHLGVEKNEKIFASSLIETKTALEKRIEQMADKGKMKYLSKRWVQLCVILFSVGAIIPIYAMGEHLLMKLQPKIMIKEEIEESVEIKTELVRMDNGTVKTIYDSSDYTKATVFVECLIPSDTRYTYAAREIKAGDELVIMVSNAAKEIYWAGIKNVNTQEVICLEDNRAMSHTFIIKEDGMYEVIIQNCSETDCAFDVFVMFFDR